MYERTKKALDFYFSVMTLIIFSPLMLVIALLIKIESKGPVYFKQKRIGLNSKEFTIYKYRSMRIDTPNVATDKLMDPSFYITKTGKFLRKTSLDELPQLINIAKGEMSFIGPRPALYNQYELINERNKFNINSIKPGLSGYAQVKGRDLISEDEKINYDYHYYCNQSFLMDGKILFLTVKNVFIGEGIIEK